MDFEEYKTNVSSRFDALVDEEREQVIEFLGSPIGEIIEPTAPVRRGLAAPII